MKIFDGLPELATAAGETLGSSDWVAVDQERIDRFADATGDHQWIHVDTERAAGAVRRHHRPRLLTLSLLPALPAADLPVDGVSMAVNYGVDKVRFTAPVPVGSKLRATRPGSAEVTPLDGAVQVKLITAIEIEGGRSPPAWSSSVVRYVGYGRPGWLGAGGPPS